MGNAVEETVSVQIFEAVSSFEFTFTEACK